MLNAVPGDHGVVQVAGEADTSKVKTVTAPREGRTVRILTAALLAAVALIATGERAASNDGSDFYNFWGVSAAMRLSGGGVGLPWTNGPEYLATLKARAATGGDAKFRSAGEYWSTSDYTGSPLLYTIFAAFPLNYTLSLAIFQLLQLVAYLGTFMLLGRAYGLDPFVATCLALVALISYQPVLSDLRVANLGCLQFAILGALVVGARKLKRVRAPRGRVALGWRNASVAGNADEQHEGRDSLARERTQAKQNPREPVFSAQRFIPATVAAIARRT